MSVRKLNWLKFGGLVGLAFGLGLLFAGLLNLPGSTLAQGGGTNRLTSQAPAKPAAATPDIPAARSLVDLSDAFSAVAEHVRPSVVFIRAERRQQVSTARIPRAFEPFFGPLPRQRDTIIQRGSGSGFIVSDDGYILTNNHVVDGAEKVTVRLLDRRQFQAKVIGTDPLTDVAVIKIDARGLAPATLGSSGSTRIGEWVLAIGNPLGDNLTFTVTSGIVSAKGRGQLNLPGRTDRTIQDFIQTDAAINPGNSGGPLVNVRGEVIGINSAIASETGYSQGYGFAIPIDLAKNVMDQLIKNGKVERAALGVFVDEATATDAEYVGLPGVRGVRIQRFSNDNSPARTAGLAPGDIILAIDGQAIESVAQLQQLVGFKRPGQTVRVDVARKGGERKTFAVRLTSVSATSETAANEEEPGDERRREGAEESPAAAAVQPLGVTIRPVTAALAEDLGMANPRGVLVESVEEDGPAAEQLIAGADVVLRVEGTPVRNAAELRAALRQAGPGRIVTLIVYNPRFQERVVRVALR
ncbi:MAG: trypsin-like peptidase domain-containing protein [Gemmatimonadales bacterium]